VPGESPSHPGWYPDQNGAMRWFDGASWTDHVQPGTGAPAGGAEPTMVQPSTPEPTRPLAQQPGWPPAGPPAGPPTGPPPQGPPAGSPYGAVPQPSFPGGPAGPGGPGGFPPPSSGGGNKGLLILLAVVGAVVLIAILAVGSWAVFLRDSDSDSGNGGDNSSLPDTGPKEVAEAFMEGVKANDCDALEDLVTEKLLEEEGGCQVEDMPADFSYVVSEPVINGETATVPVVLTVVGFEDEPASLILNMVVDDDEWKVDELVDPEDATDTPTDLPTDVTTDLPTDLPTDFSDFPTDFSDFPTDFPTEFPTDPSELESYLETYLSDFLTYTG
jgi:hypothetical protein